MLAGPRIVRKDEIKPPPMDVMVYHSITVNEDKDQNKTREGRTEELTTVTSKWATWQNLVLRMRTSTISTISTTSTISTISTISTTQQESTTVNPVLLRGLTTVTPESSINKTAGASSLNTTTTITEPDLSNESNTEMIDTNLLPDTTTSSSPPSSSTTGLPRTSLPSYHSSLSTEVESLQHDLQSGVFAFFHYAFSTSLF